MELIEVKRPSTFRGGGFDYFFVKGLDSFNLILMGFITSLPDDIAEVQTLTNFFSTGVRSIPKFPKMPHVKVLDIQGWRGAEKFEFISGLDSFCGVEQVRFHD
mmetsp:Transcript_25594/g.60517  ORF Transcript_25594/g.60517 Transcript_25594/m.60517 type:complete len:103 (-) Transcript_25594:709-1017(-)